MKTCSKCKETKELTEYHKDKSNKDGLYCICKVCNNKQKQIRYYLSVARNPNINKKLLEDNLKKCSKCKEVFNISFFSKSNRSKYGLNSMCRSCCSVYYNTNKEIILLKKRIYYAKKGKDKDKSRDYSKNYYYKNKSKVIKKNNQYHKKMYLNGSLYKIKKDIRTVVRRCLSDKGYTKRSRTNEILGCSFEDFKLHLERQFTKGMNWDNRDKWHIDHIIPMATAKTEEDVIRLNHYTNLRPLWAEENLSKSDKIITHQLVLL